VLAFLLQHYVVAGLTFRLDQGVSRNAHPSGRGPMMPADAFEARWRHGRPRTGRSKRLSSTASAASGLPIATCRAWRLTAFSCGYRPQNLHDRCPHPPRSFPGAAAARSRPRALRRCRGDRRAGGPGLARRVCRRPANAFLRPLLAAPERPGASLRKLPVPRQHR
jgi:hypothetical protein